MNFPLSELCGNAPIAIEVHIQSVKAPSGFNAIRLLMAAGNMSAQSDEEESHRLYVAGRMSQAVCSRLY